MLMTKTLIVLFLLIQTVILAHKQQSVKYINNFLNYNEDIVVQVSINYKKQFLYQQQFNFKYSIQQQPIQKSIDFNIPNQLQQNITIQVRQYYFKNNKKTLLFARQKNLTRYQRIFKANLLQFHSFDPIDQISSVQQQQQNKQTQQYRTHIPNSYNFLVIVSNTSIPHNYLRQFNLQMIARDGDYKYVSPIDINQIHIQTRNSSILNQTKHKMKILIKPYDLQTYSITGGMFNIDQFNRRYGNMKLFQQQDFDDLKQMFFTNSIWMVVLFFVLSLAQSILKFVFIKSQYTFWKNIQNNKGVSLKVLFFQFIANIIMFLSSRLIIFFSGIDLLIDVWKITRTFKVKIKKTFPFLYLETSQHYKQRQQIDNNAVKYMTKYFLTPAMVIFIIYRLNSLNWKIKSYYLFFLQTAVTYIAIFGFILMTPQLYLNYKLKSVDHLNWKGLITRFINTIIDDLFALMITMPMTRRLMYFRDDVIFLIYLYQRQIYKVDYSRGTIYTANQQTGQKIEKIQ